MLRVAMSDDAHAKSRGGSRSVNWRDRLILLGVATLGLAVFPVIAEGDRLAYRTFAVASLLGGILAPTIQRRWKALPNRQTQLGVGFSVGIVLIVTSLGAPAIETALLGLAVGGLIGIAVFGFLPKREA
jgi:hypothetical protein